MIKATPTGFIDFMYHTRKELRMKTSKSFMFRESSLNRKTQRRPVVRRVMLQLGVAAAVVALAAVASAGLPPAQLLSARNPSVSPPAGGNGDSVDAVVSPDGRFVAFSSAACDLVPGDDRQFSMNVYLRDRASNTTVRVSMNLAGTGGGDAPSFLGQVSTNGQFVLFESGANNLVAADTNWSRDIYVRNVPAGTNILVSVATNGGPANGASYDAVMTPDGRYVAFVSGASNLVPGGDTNGLADVFVRDLVAGTTTLVSVGATGYGTMATPQITPDGRYVAFFSSATGLVASAGPSANGEIYVRDLLAGTTTWASANAAAMVQAVFGPATTTNIVSYRPRVSDDGRFIAFMSGATTISGGTAILVYDQSAGVTTVITTNAVGSFATNSLSWPPNSYQPRLDENRFGPEMTADGRFIAYASREPAAGGTNSSVHVWDSLASTDWAVSTNGSGVPANTISYTPVLSGNGGFVAFLSNATNLVANPVSAGFHLYLGNLQSGALQLVDVDTNGAGSTDLGNTYPSLSADGRVVTFSAPDGRLVAGDWNNALDVFARDTLAGANELVSQRDPARVSGVGNGLTRKSPFSISGDGRWFVFESFANDLLPKDTNGFCDIFLKDLWTGQITLVSAAANGTPALGGNSYGGVISANGSYVAFASVATNLTANPAVTNLNIFRKDLQTGATILISVSTNGTGSAAGNCSDAVISADGRYVTFLSTAQNLAPGTSSTFGSISTFWRDVNSGSTIVLNSGGTTLLPSMSADGRYVAYQTNQLNQLRIRNTQLGRDIYTNSATILSAAISPDGGRVLYRRTSPDQVSVDQIATRSILLSFSSTAPVQSSSQWSSDGRYVVFVGNTNATNAVFVCDLATSSTTLVSCSAANGGVANAPSDMPVISGDGRYVVYRSYATDIVTGDTNPAPKIYLFDRFSGHNTILSAAQTDATPFPWISVPVISGGAENVAFLSAGSDLAANDLNRVPDAFAVRVLYRIQITPVATPGGNTTLTWQAVPLRTYGVQFKNGLNDPQWQDLPTSISFVGNEGMVTVPADQPGRFYRVVENQ
jgi:Tol biopolymer transport system component